MTPVRTEPSAKIEIAFRVLHASWPCCGRRLHAKTIPSITAEPIELTCRRCFRNFVVVLRRPTDHAAQIGGVTGVIEWECE